MRKFYGIGYSEFSLSDTAETVRAWGTADVFAFQTKAARDEWADESHLNYPCTASYAHKCGGAKPYEA